MKMVTDGIAQNKTKQKLPSFGANLCNQFDFGQLMNQTL